MSEREVTLKLATKADSSLTEPYERMGKAAKAAADQERKYQEMSKGRAGMMGQMGQVGRGALSGNVGGMAQGAAGMMMGAGPAGAAIAAVAALQQGAEKAAKSMEIMNNSAATSTQKFEALTKEFVPGAETLYRFRDALNGVTDKMMRLQVVMAHQQLSGAEAYEKESRVAGLQAEAGRHRNLATEMGKAVVPQTLMGIDRSTWKGELEHQRASTLFAPQAELGRAEAAARAAQKDYNSSGARVESLREKNALAHANVEKAAWAERVLGGKEKGVTEFSADYMAAKKFVAKITKGSETADMKQSFTSGAGGGSALTTFLGGGAASYLLGAIGPSMTGGGPGMAAVMPDGGTEKFQRTAAGVVSMKAQQDALSNSKQLEEEINRQKEYGVSLAEKESAVRKAQNNVLKAELGLLQQKEQRQSHGAQALGMMNPAQQAKAAAAAKMLKNGTPINMLPPSMRGLVQQVAPGAVAKMAETQGAKSNAFKTFQEAGLIDKGSLAETRQEIAKGKTQVEVNVNLDTATMADQLAKRMVEIFGKGFEKLVKDIEQRTEIQHEQMRTGQNVRNASHG